MSQGPVYIISNIDRWVAFEWLATAFAERGEPITFILMNAGDSHMQRWLEAEGHTVHYIRWRGNKDYPAALLAVWKLLRRLRPKTVHCHFLHATIVGLTAAWLLGIKQRIFTRHHSTFHHDYAPRGVWLDKYCNRMATHILAITSMVKGILTDREEVPEEKIHLMHHGFRFDDFLQADPAGIAALREKYQLPAGKKIIGVVARHIRWKGVQHIVEAFTTLQKEQPDLVLFLANARGDYHQHILDMVAPLPAESYRIVPFEPAIEQLFYLFDYYVHTPVNPQIEAFGQTYVEALACGRPSIFTLSGIAPDFIEHERNALVVPFADAAAIRAALLRLLNDDALAQKIATQGREDVLNQFSFEQMFANLRSIYSA